MGKTATGKTKKENAWRTLSATGALAAASFLQAPAAQADAAVLFGLNRNTPDTTIRFSLEYEI